MSHFEERKEKNCLNCNATVVGRFCHECGQENIEPKESFFHLLKHLIFHEFHYDGKFISTVHHLLLKPGFLSSEYLIGKRTKYLDPIRMYIFISAFFFLVLFNLQKDEKVDTHHKEANNVENTTEHLSSLKEDLIDSITDNELSQEKKKEIQRKITNLDKLKEGIKHNSKQLDSITEVFSDKKHKATFLWNATDSLSLEEYELAQSKLPVEQKDNWLKRFITIKTIQTRDKLRENPREFFSELGHHLKHEVPEILFVSLPFFALILQLLYMKKRKELFYVNHFIYTLHLYCAAFLFLLLFIILDRLDSLSNLQWLSYLEITIFVYWLYYNYRAMRNFYGDSRRKTITKYVLINIFSTAMMIIFILLFGLFAAFNA